MRRNTPWTDKQVNYLKENYPTGCVDEMSEYLNKPIPAIRSYAAYLKIRRAKAIHIHEYAMYNGDEFIMIGTAYEIGKALGIEPESVRWYSTSSALERLEKSGNAENRRIAVKL